MQTEIKKIVMDTLKDLQKKKVITKNLKISDNSVLLGDNSILDSIGFVTFLTNCEESFQKNFKKNFIIKMNEIHDLNQGKHFLKLIDFVKAVDKLIAK